jgi:transposase-like protein
MAKKKFNSQGKTVKQLAEEYGISPTVVYNRMHLARKNGSSWDLEKALTTPVKQRKRKPKETVKVTKPSAPAPSTIKLNPPGLNENKAKKIENDGVFASVIFILVIAVVAYFVIQNA